jgi:3(or 17)beta-hydroxysteroid dehydrogenase
MAEFAGRTVIVTGAEGGIGAEISAQFAAAGARVHATGIRSERGRELAARLGAAVTWHELDVTDEAAWIRVVAEVVARHGRLDVLVNNAGFLEAGLTVEDTSLADWRRHFAVNTDGAFLGCKHAILSMKQTGGGAIVNVCSAVAVRLHPQSPAYGVSKAALLAWTRVAALHCGQRKYGIRVNAVLPGPIDTEMMRSNVASEAEFEALRSMLIAKYPMERIGAPADVANAVLYLASEKSAYVNGVAFAVDGGQSA